MSGPVQDRDQSSENESGDRIEVRQGRVADVGGMGVARVLPTKGRRTIGGWCFVDLMTPGDIVRPPPLEIGPHPHIGLATVTWLFEGTALHGDSLGTEQLIRPGELNLMTSGRGIAHAELGVHPTGLGSRVGGISGAQMWIAQPESTRHGASRFQHLADLPRIDLGSGEAHLMVGSLAGAGSAAKVDTAVVGLDVTMRPSVEIPAVQSFEYGVVPIDRSVKVGDTIVDSGSIAIIASGLDSIRLSVDGGHGRALVLGGEPLGERVQTWWNFVARTKDEITEAWHDWQDHNEDRFGPVPSHLARIDAPTPMWIRNPEAT